MLWLLKLYMSPLIAGMWMPLYSSTCNLTLQHKTRLNVVHTRRQMQFTTSNQMDLPKQMAFCSSAACGNTKISKLHTKDKDRKHDKRILNYIQKTKTGSMTDCQISSATSVNRTVLQEIEKQTAIGHKVCHRVNPWRQRNDAEPLIRRDCNAMMLSNQQGLSGRTAMQHKLSRAQGVA